LSGQYQFKVGGGEAQHLQGSNCRGIVSAADRLSIPTSAASAKSARNPFTASSTPVHEDLPRQKIPQRRYAFFLEQSLLFPRR
jgi:hypothetical protein